MTTAHLIDLSLLVAYLVGITAYGIFVGRRSASTQEGYFLGGRKFGWFTIGASIFAANISITHFMGGGGLSYRVGFASVNNDLIGGVLLVVSAIFFVPVYIRSGLLTMPQFLERRFSRLTRQVFGWIFLVQSALHQPAGYYIGGLALLGLFGFPDSYLPFTCFVVGSTVGLISVVGGLTSVVKTEVVQAALLVGAGLTVSFIGVQRAGGMMALHEQFGPTHFKLLLPQGTDMPWTTLPGVALHSSFFAFCSIPILQRALSARNEYQAQCGMLFAGFLKLLAIPLIALPGIVALKMYPDTMADATYAFLVRDILPAGISGLVMVGMISALMSSADASVNAMASVVAIDLYPSFARQPTESRALRLGKWAAALIVVFSVLAAPWYVRLGAIYLVILKLGGFLFMPVGVCFICGRFSRRVNHHGALVCLVVGGTLGLTYVLLTCLPPLAHFVPGWLQRRHFYEILPFFFLLCTALMFVVSYATAPPPPERLAVLDLPPGSDAGPEESRPRAQQFKLLVALFFALVGLCYLAF